MQRVLDAGPDPGLDDLGELFHADADRIKKCCGLPAVQHPSSLDKKVRRRSAAPGRGSRCGTPQQSILDPVVVDEVDGITKGLHMSRGVDLALSGRCWL